MQKMRISLSDKGGDIHGKVEVEGNYAFTKEALLIVMEAVARPFGMSAKDLIIELYHTNNREST